MRRKQALQRAAERLRESHDEPPPPPEVFTLASHSRAASAMVPSPDGRFVATAALDGTIHLVDAVDARVMLACEVPAVDAVRMGVGNDWPADSPRAQPLAVALAITGESLLVGATDGAIHRLDLRTGQWLPAWRGARGGITALATFPAMSAILTADSLGEIAVWDAHSGEIRARLAPPISRPVGVPPAAFDAARHLAVTIAPLDATTDGLIVWDVAARECVAQVPMMGVAMLAFDAVNARVIVGGQSLLALPITDWPAFGTAATVIAFAFPEMATMPAAMVAQFFLCAEVSADGRFLAVGCRDGYVRVWALAQPAAPVLTARVQPPGFAVAAVKIFADGRIAAIGADGALRMIL